MTAEPLTVRARNLGSQHRGKHITYGDKLHGILTAVEPDDRLTGIELKEFPGMRWLIPGGDELVVADRQEKAA